MVKTRRGRVIPSDAVTVAGSRFAFPQRFQAVAPYAPVGGGPVRDTREEAMRDAVAFAEQRDDEVADGSRWAVLRHAFTISEAEAALRVLQAALREPAS